MRKPHFLFLFFLPAWHEYRRQATQREERRIRFLKANTDLHSPGKHMDIHTNGGAAFDFKKRELLSSLCVPGTYMGQAGH